MHETPNSVLPFNLSIVSNMNNVLWDTGRHKRWVLGRRRK